MTKITVESKEKEEKKFLHSLGDIVEYPDGAVVLITGWREDDFECFEGICLKTTKYCTIAKLRLGTYWRKFHYPQQTPPKRFVGRVVLEQTEEDDD